MMISQDNNHEFQTELSWDISSKALMPYVSFISTPGCHAAAVGLSTDPHPIQSKRKVRKMKNGSKDAAMVIWCHDVS